MAANNLTVLSHSAGGHNETELMLQNMFEEDKSTPSAHTPFISNDQQSSDSLTSQTSFLWSSLPLTPVVAPLTWIKSAD